MKMRMKVKKLNQTALIDCDSILHNCTTKLNFKQCVLVIPNSLSHDIYIT